MKRWPAFEKFRALARKNYNLEGLEKYVPFYGMDIHAPHLLPGKYGRLELEIDGPVSQKSIIAGLRQGRVKFEAPKNINFWHSLFWAFRDMGMAVIDEIILERLINRRVAKASARVSRKFPVRKPIAVASVEDEKENHSIKSL